MSNFNWHTCLLGCGAWDILRLLATDSKVIISESEMRRLLKLSLRECCILSRDFPMG